MVEFWTKNPDKFSDIMVDYIDDSEQINEEIMEIVRDHPKIDPQKIRFFTDPYELMANIVKDHDRIKCILNFCDDFSDRVELLSIPTMFEIYRLPFSGYAEKGLLSHDKFYAYSIAKQLGVPVPKSYYINRDTVDELNVENYPVLVKPNNEGGSEGVSFKSLAHDQAELQDVLSEMLKSYEELIACDYLPGNELTIGIMRHEDEIIPLTLKVLQFVNFGDDPAIYTGDYKWDESLLGVKKLVVKPFDGDAAIKEQVVYDSIKLFKVFECKDYARIDWKCDKYGNPKFIDFNENPMFGKDSSFLYCLEHAGYTRRDLFNNIIDNLLLMTNRPA